MIFDLRDETDLPAKLAPALKTLQEFTVVAIRKYVDYHELDIEKFTAAHFRSPLGQHVGCVCKLAADISASLGCPVHFEFNGRSLTAWPTTAKAVEAMFHAPIARQE